MDIESLRVRNFRSIDDIKLSLPEFSVVTGPNGVGKSNLLQAIQFAFRSEISTDQVYWNLPYHRRDIQGGPGLSIWVTATFKNVPSALAEIAGSPSANRLTYEFRAKRNGQVTRRLANKQLSNIDEITQYFDVVYVPPIRDLNVGGISAFKTLFADALRRARGTSQINQEIQRELAERATRILSNQSIFASSLLGAQSLVADTSQVVIEDIYKTPVLKAVYPHGEELLENHGTGHQSLVIINLYRQLGELTPGSCLYLFEEPDNHLHPTMVRSIANELESLSQNAQVITTTHSPILIDHVGLNRTIRATSTPNRTAEFTPITVPDKKEAEIRALINQHGVRAIEPILARRVILVEGPSDVTILRSLAESRSGSQIENCEILIIPALGKHGVAKMAGLLSELDCDWYAVLDWDAAFGGQPPMADHSLTADFDDAVNAIDNLIDFLDVNGARGRGLRKSFAALREEFTEGPPSVTVLDDSSLLQLLHNTGVFTAALERDLKRNLRNRKLRATWDLLEPRRIILWSGRVEDVLLTRESAVYAAEQALTERGINVRNTGAIGDRRDRVANQLHNLTTRPEILVHAVKTLESGGHLSRTQMNRAFRLLFS